MQKMFFIITLQISLLIVFNHGEKVNSDVKTNLDRCKISQFGAEYRGKIYTTETGVRCQFWHGDSQLHDVHPGIKDDDFPERSIRQAKNYCRNPTMDPRGPWCYTMDPNIIDEECAIPLCNFGDCRISGSGAEYAGPQATSTSGKKCKSWNKRYKTIQGKTEKFANKNFPDPSKGKAKNFCRNPSDDSGGPWCYVEEENYELVMMEYCDVPFCDERDCLVYTRNASEYSTITMMSSNAGNMTVRIKLWDPNDENEVIFLNSYRPLTDERSTEWTDRYGYTINNQKSNNGSTRAFSIYHMNLQGQAKLLLSALPIPTSSRIIAEKWRAGCELLISNSGSGQLHPNSEDEVDLEPTPNILLSSNWTELNIHWAGGFISVTVHGSAKPIFLEEFGKKNSITDLTENSFFYYGLMGTGVLWSTTECLESCQVHTTYGMDFIRSWPFQESNTTYDIRFHVRAPEKVALRLYQSPGKPYPCLTITIGESKTITLIYQESAKAVKQSLKEIPIENLLDIWSWKEFTLSIFGPHLRLFIEKHYGNEEILYAKEELFSTLRWFSIGSDDVIAHWTLFCAPDEANLVEAPSPPNCLVNPGDYLYQGSQWLAGNSQPCIPWISKDIPEEERKNDLFPEGSVIKALNKCRNPLHDPKGPYCYTRSSSSESVKKHCSIRSCRSSECRTAGTANDYIGKLSVTRSGRTCAPWVVDYDLDKLEIKPKSSTKQEMSSTETTTVIPTTSTTQKTSSTERTSTTVSSTTLTTQKISSTEEATTVPSTTLTTQRMSSIAKTITTEVTSTSRRSKIFDKFKKPNYGGNVMDMNYGDYGDVESTTQEVTSTERPTTISKSTSTTQKMSSTKKISSTASSTASTTEKVRSTEKSTTTVATSTSRRSKLVDKFKKPKWGGNVMDMNYGDYGDGESTTQQVTSPEEPATTAPTSTSTIQKISSTKKSTTTVSTSTSSRPKLVDKFKKPKWGGNVMDMNYGDYGDGESTTQQVTSPEEPATTAPTSTSTTQKISSTKKSTTTVSTSTSSRPKLVDKFKKPKWGGNVMDMNYGDYGDVDGDSTTPEVTSTEEPTTSPPTTSSTRRTTSTEKSPTPVATSTPRRSALVDKFSKKPKWGGNVMDMSYGDYGDVDTDVDAETTTKKLTSTAKPTTLSTSTAKPTTVSTSTAKPTTVSTSTSRRSALVDKFKKKPSWGGNVMDMSYGDYDNVDDDTETTTQKITSTEEPTTSVPTSTSRRSALLDKFKKKPKWSGNVMDMSYGDYGEGDSHHRMKRSGKRRLLRIKRSSSAQHQPQHQHSLRKKRDDKILDISKQLNAFFGNKNKHQTREKPVNPVNPDYFNDTLYPEQSAKNASNYCRNPSRNMAGTWCYTTDPEVPQDLCDVRDCDKSDECILLVRGQASEKKFFILPQYRSEGFHFSIKAWEPDNPDSITFTFTADEGFSSKYILKIGAMSNEKVLLYYQGEEGAPELVKKKTLPHLLFLGKWSNFLVKMPRDKILIYYEGAPNPLFEWEQTDSSKSFLPIYYQYASELGNAIGVSFDCLSICQVETTQSERFTIIIPITGNSRRIQLMIRAQGVVLVPLLLFPATPGYYALTLGELDQWIYFLRNSYPNVQIFHKQKIPAPRLFTKNTWTNITITWHDKTLNVYWNDSLVFNYVHTHPLLFYFFSLAVDKGGLATWTANCMPPEIDGDPVDGGWSEWGPWACSASCNGGVGTRKRLCNNPEPNIRGEPCMGPGIMAGKCNMILCGDITEDTVNLIKRRLQRNHTSIIIKEGQGIIIPADSDVIEIIGREAPDLRIDWSCNGIYIKEHEERIELIDEDIVIKRSKVNDSGVYTMTLLRADGTHMILKLVSLAVLPVKTIVTLRETMPMTIVCHCVTLGYLYNDLKVFWTLNNIIWKDYGTTQPLSVNVDHVPSLNSTHRGLWQCGIKQDDLGFNWTTNAFFVNVIGPPNWKTHLMEDEFTRPIFGWMPNESFVAPLLLVITGFIMAAIVVGTIMYLRFQKGLKGVISPNIAKTYNQVSDKLLKKGKNKNSNSEETKQLLSEPKAQN